MAELIPNDADLSGGDRPRFARTTISPAPGNADVADEPRRGHRRKRVKAVGTSELVQARPPFPGTSMIRLFLAGLLFVMALLTLAGAVLMLLLWQQHRDAGVLTTQIDRAWELFDKARRIERVVAFAVVPVSLIWVVMATLNVRRGTGQRRNPIASAGALLVGVAGVWYVGAQFVAPADDWIGRAVGYVFQAVCVIVPLLALERVAEAAEARRRPLRAAALIAVVTLVHVQEKAGLSNTEATADASKWGMLGAYFVIGALLMALGTLAVNEAARAIEEATQHRYDLRSRFGESVLSQAGLLP